jgi:hypothetical protein
MILAIDPGPVESAYVLMDGLTLKPLAFGKLPNNDLRSRFFGTKHYTAIEMVASFGMAVGAEVFETCVWIGRFMEAIGGMSCTRIPRIKVKQHLCHDSRAKDANIIQALKDRFGDKGTKKNPGWFYGFAADVWQAYALGVTYADDTPF